MHSLRKKDGRIIVEQDNVIASAAAYEECAFAPRDGERISVETIKHTGHFVMLDQPEEFNRRLTNKPL